MVARTWGAPGGLGAAQRVRALVGEAGLAAAGLAESVATLTGSSYALTLAEARVDYGVALRRAGQRSAARAELEAGLEGAARCEASLLPSGPEPSCWCWEPARAG